MIHYLLRLQLTGRRDDVELISDYDLAVFAAREYVGEHNPADGCSSKPLIFEKAKTGLFRITRSSSFGQRRATVQPIYFGERTELL